DLAGQSEGVVEFAVSEESGVTGDGRTVELELDFAIKIDAEGVILAVTHWVSQSLGQEIVGNAGFSREKAQTPCRNDRAIWESRDKGYMPLIETKYQFKPEKMPFDFPEVVASFAPRAFLASAPVGDDNFEVSGVKDCIAAAQPVY